MTKPPPATAGKPEGAAMSTTSPTTTRVSVSGMTCGHCVSAVSEELEALAGVEEVSVELNAGGISTVTITSSTELSPSEIGEAVAEAGYLVVANEA
jgi:copper chaperone